MGIYGKNPFDEGGEEGLTDSIWNIPQGQTQLPAQESQIFPAVPQQQPPAQVQPGVAPEEKKQERKKKEKARDYAYLLNFRLGNEKYGVYVDNIREVVRMTKITPVPNTHYHVLGIMNLRGRILPVISLRRFFGMPDEIDDKKSKILIAETKDGKQVGILVDDVLEVMTFYPSEMEPITTIKFSGAKYARGVIRKDDEPIVVIDINEVITESLAM